MDEKLDLHLSKLVSLFNQRVFTNAELLEIAKGLTMPVSVDFTEFYKALAKDFFAKLNVIRLSNDKNLCPVIVGEFAKFTVDALEMLRKNGVEFLDIFADDKNTNSVLVWRQKHIDNVLRLKQQYQRLSIRGIEHKIKEVEAEALLPSFRGARVVSIMTGNPAMLAFFEGERLARRKQAHKDWDFVRTKKLGWEPQSARARALFPEGAPKKNVAEKKKKTEEES